jgi:hypothetical protein
MDETFDILLARRLDGHASAVDDSDWRDVRHRAGRQAPTWRRPRTFVLAAAILLAIGLLAAPGWGLRSSMVDLFTGEQAPPEIQEVARGTGVFGAPRDVVAEETRRVLAIELSDGRRATLWVAPSASGGTCVLVTRGKPSGRAECTTGPAPTDTVEWDVGARGEFDEMVLLRGRAPDGTQRVELEFGDGATAVLAVTKGFFMHEVPLPHHRVGARPSALTAYGVDGDELARTDIPFQDVVYGVYTGPRPPG